MILYFFQISDTYFTDRYCGKELPPLITSTDSLLKITLTAGYVMLIQNFKGFEAVYALTGDVVIFCFTPYPQFYNEHLIHCYARIPFSHEWQYTWFGFGLMAHIF